MRKTYYGEDDMYSEQYDSDLDGYDISEEDLECKDFFVQETSESGYFEEDEDRGEVSETEYAVTDDGIDKCRTSPTQEQLKMAEKYSYNEIIECLQGKSSQFTIKEAQELLYWKVYKWICKKAKERYPTYVNTDDNKQILVDTAYLHLLEAAMKFDTERNYKFLTYATKFIYSGFYEHIRYLRQSTKHYSKIQKDLKEIIDSYMFENDGKMPELHIIAKISGKKPDVIENMLNVMKNVNNMLPLDENLVRIPYDSPEIAMIRDEEKETLYKALDELEAEDEEIAAIIKLRFGTSKTGVVMFRGKEYPVNSECEPKKIVEMLDDEEITADYVYTQISKGLRKLRASETMAHLREEKHPKVTHRTDELYQCGMDLESDKELKNLERMITISEAYAGMPYSY